MYIQKNSLSNIIETWLNIRNRGICTKVYSRKKQKYIYKCTYCPVVYPDIYSLRIGSDIEAKHYRKLRLSKYGEFVEYESHENKDPDGWYKAKIIGIRDNYINVRFYHNNIKERIHENTEKYKFIRYPNHKSNYKFRCKFCKLYFCKNHIKYCDQNNKICVNCIEKYDISNFNHVPKLTSRFSSIPLAEPGV
jgi:hypothetical protein